MVTFFNNDELVDFDSNAKHIQRLLDSGVTGLVVHGSNGEATHLTHEERSEVIRHARRTIREQGKEATIIAGCSANSVRETLMYIDEATQAGAQYALVLPPNYWSATMTKDVIASFYTEVSTHLLPVLFRPFSLTASLLKVASRSTLPIIIYNFPGVTSGIDIDSDLVLKLASSSPNIVGVKLTCGNVGKLQRITAALSPMRFSAFAGKADFLLPGLVAGSNGVISALANIVPRLHLHVLQLYEAGKLQEARQIQNRLSRADADLQKLGISGVKAASSIYFGYGSAKPRSPLPMASEQGFTASIRESMQGVVDLERQLASGATRLRDSKL
jgi:4-hydroxy-2-oxoglutarate aldolase